VLTIRKMSQTHLVHVLQRICRSKPLQKRVATALLLNAIPSQTRFVNMTLLGGASTDGGRRTMMAFKETRARIIPKKAPRDPQAQQPQDYQPQNYLQDPSQQQYSLQAQQPPPQQTPQQWDPEQLKQIQQQLQAEADKPIPLSTMLKESFVWGIGITLAFAVVGALFR